MKRAVRSRRGRKGIDLPTPARSISVGMPRRASDVAESSEIDGAQRLRRARLLGHQPPVATANVSAASIGQAEVPAVQRLLDNTMPLWLANHGGRAIQSLIADYNHLEKSLFQEDPLNPFGVTEEPPTWTRKSRMWSAARCWSSWTRFIR